MLRLVMDSMAHTLTRFAVSCAIVIVCATFAHAQSGIAPDGAPPGWHAAYDAAQAGFLGCVQSQRSPAWSEFAQPPSGELAYTAWSNRFQAASLQASELCQRQEASAAFAICKLMQQQPPLCKAWLNVLVGSVLNGRTICDATHCVTAIP